MRKSKLDKFRIDLYGFYGKKIGQKTIYARSEDEVHNFVYSKDFKHKRKSDMRGFSITKVK